MDMTAQQATISYPNSKSLYERARKVLPGGTARTSTFDKPHPLYAAHGIGCTLTDIDGNARVDFHNNYTALAHGHAHPALLEAAVRQMGQGASFCFASEPEVALAETLVSRIPGLEQVRFMCSGTEAVMMAIKAARAATGRTLIAKCEGAFHGSYDYVEVSYDSAPENWGAPENPSSVPFVKATPPGTLEEVVAIPFNDANAALHALAPHADRLAAVIVDAMPNRVGLIPATTEFLKALRNFTRRNGIVLISDEVINFRLSHGGAQPLFNFDADLTVFGKIIGGGFPVGAVGGKRAVMEVFDPSKGKPAVSQSGTFSASPVAMAAGKVAVDMLDVAALDRLEQLGDRLRAALKNSFDRHRVEGQVTGMGSLFRVHFKSTPLRNYRDAYPAERDKRRLGACYKFMLEKGFILTSVGMGCLSTPMQEAQIDSVAAAFDEFVAALARDEERTIARYAA
jgi:glutamate-1-semialdehyde 2,1-aminomutase